MTGSEGESQHVRSLLAGEERDFLVRNNGDQIIGLYFSASWCGPCRRFTPNLVEVYNELLSRGNFEVVLISDDHDEEAFNGYFSKMPWLAMPFSDASDRDRLKKLFKVRGIPSLVIIDGATGKVLTVKGTSVVGDYGSGSYPFTPERLNECQEVEEEARRNQTLKSILVSGSRDFLVSNDGNKVPISELEGRMIGLYFSTSGYGRCAEFTLKLKQVYEELKRRGEGLEIVLISLDDEEQSFDRDFKGMPWLALPFLDQTYEKLIRYFELQAIPTLVIIGKDGKTLHSNAAELIEEHGMEAYPFSSEKLAWMAEIEKAKREAQTLESLLVSGELDYVIGKDGVKVPVSELVGKNILLYFSASRCAPCRAFLPKLVDAYHKIKAKDTAFEVIFISSDTDEASFDGFYAGMPWLALPFGDDRKKSLGRTFKILGIPAMVAIGPSGRTVTDEAKELISRFGPDAYPFTDEKVKVLEAKLEEMMKGWPEKLKLALHDQHELNLTRRSTYICDDCEEEVSDWAYSCELCDFDVHPKCAFGMDDVKGGGPRRLRERKMRMKNSLMVKIENLNGKIIGLYFSASWCGPCRRFTPNLVEVYNELLSRGNFEVVFISDDHVEEAFNGYFSKMPWLAMPFSDASDRDRLKKLFKVRGIPSLVIIDGATGKVLTVKGTSLVGNYGSGSYPFTPERLNECQEVEEAARRNQTLKSILVSGSRDFLVSNDGNKVPISELEGRMIGLYFSTSGYGRCAEFTLKLKQVYEELKKRGESLEIVLISLDDEEQSFDQDFKGMPWLALPFHDQTCEKLIRYFELQALPMLVIIGKDGKTLHSNADGLIEEHGMEAYPFSSEKLAWMAEIEKAKREAQTLESLLVSGPSFRTCWEEYPPYFSASWCPPCRAFLPKLVDAYHKIKAKDTAFEVIFISSDTDEASFDGFYAGMPWLALPFGDDRKKSLGRTFKILGIPAMVAIGPSGRTVTDEAKELISRFGPDAYPFTDEKVKVLEAKLKEMMKGWPEKLKLALHDQHELKLTRRSTYICDDCEEEVSDWAYSCELCDFDVHPKCAFGKDDVKGGGAEEVEGKEDENEKQYDGMEGYVCDGDVCRKV
ncbi:putative nucleoredoxin 1 [Acorus calamus]|uniref:protein-disulfide reductase n=1 Tax=Acorus calamus TaxID=4465 RepID=A0AAV9DQT1_ACOCL|nr:putative nucleoredoxin 1 [Acorus calamus]